MTETRPWGARGSAYARISDGRLVYVSAAVWNHAPETTSHAEIEAADDTRLVITPRDTPGAGTRTAHHNSGVQFAATRELAALGVDRGQRSYHPAWWDAEAGTVIADLGATLENPNNYNSELVARLRQEYLDAREPDEAVRDEPWFPTRVMTANPAYQPHTRHDRPLFGGRGGERKRAILEYLARRTHAEGHVWHTTAAIRTALGLSPQATGESCHQLESAGALRRWCENASTWALAGLPETDAHNPTETRGSPPPDTTATSETVEVGDD